MNNKRLLPKSGTCENLIQRLSDYIMSIDNTWLSKLKPATVDEIGKLKRVSGLDALGLELPVEYQLYLQHMGGDDGGLLEKEWDWHSKVSIKDIIEYYKGEESDTFQYDYTLNDKHYLVFSDHWTDATLAINLCNIEKPEIVCGLENPQLHSESFENYLFQTAFKVLEKQHYPYSGGWGNSQLQIEVAIRQHNNQTIPYIISELKSKNWLTNQAGTGISFIEPYFNSLGFEKLWFSDKVNYCATMENASIMAHGHDSFWVTISGSDQDFIQKIVTTLKAEYSLDENTKNQLKQIYK